LNNSSKNLLRKVLIKEYIRRNIIKYFSDKGYDNFLVCAYPPLLVDIVDRLPFLNGLVEVTNNVDDIDIADGSIKIDWNMFVLGVRRIHLGTTIHASLNEIDRGSAYVDTFSGPVTIEKLVNTMVEFLGESKMADMVYEKSKLNCRPTIFSKQNTTNPSNFSVNKRKLY
jgi:hypothetical protein